MAAKKPLKRLAQRVPLTLPSEVYETDDPHLLELLRWHDELDEDLERRLQNLACLQQQIINRYHLGS